MCITILHTWPDGFGPSQALHNKNSKSDGGSSHSMQIEPIATLLLVYHEQNITKSVQRALRKQPYRILTAASGLIALEILESNDVDMVIADGNMPGMDGATLFAEVQHRWPDRIRIMLSSYSNMDVTIKAINAGRIHRYIAKPWNDRELCLAIAQTLEQQQLDRDKVGLQQQTCRQNLELQEANAALVAQVQEGTAAPAHSTELPEVAYASVSGSYSAVTQVFSSLINQRLPASRQTNQEIIAVVQAFCKARELAPKLTEDLVMAATLYNIGKLTWNNELIELPVERMDKDQRERYRNYPVVGENLLMTLEPTPEAAIFIRHHQERWDGGGFPAELAGQSIPLGARILKMAVDFVEMQMGMIMARKLPRDEVLGTMSKYSARLYDPLLCQDFVTAVGRMGMEDVPEGDEIGPEGGSENDTVLVLPTLALEPGMIMVQSLHAESGMLLLKKDSVLTEGFIDKLCAFEDNEDTKYALHVRRAEPEPEADAP